ncbi:unnamed protein product [Enterobius vermicularis]|uniref:Peptidase_M3 domain-containing protein n=1 Tax=Enterobius vermicularis TaxID=51028 RepID=A0A0N4UY38_ENTVE|nr:unnamed protein product [Enterobius vermicularis]
MAGIAAGNDWPSLTSSSPKEVYEGTIRMLLDYGAAVLEHVEHLKELKEGELNFANVVEPLLEKEKDIMYAFHTMLLKMYTDWPMCSTQEFSADVYHAKYTCAREQLNKLAYPEFQDAIKSLYSRREGLTSWQFRLLEFYILEMKALGLDIRVPKQCRVINSWISTAESYRISYLGSIMSTNDQNVFNVTDRSTLSDAPPYVLKLLAVDEHDVENGPWRANMSPKTIMPLLQYCSDREVRQLAWSKWTSRASFEHDFYNNSINIEEIRHNQEGLAKALGYPSVAEHRLENKMAGSPEIVRIFLNALKKRIRPVFVDRMEAWTTYANEREGIKSDLMPSDLFYICRKEALAYYNLDMMNYFPFWSTFENLTEVLSYIFGLTFKNISDKELERCHPDVRIYEVQDQFTGRYYGRLYVDPFERPNKRKGWKVLLGRKRGWDKIVYLIAEADAPKAELPSLLHYSQLQQLLFSTGRAVQILLSESPYRDITIPWEPTYAADWDAADFFPLFTEFFVYKPNLLSVIASPHRKTGQALTEDSANNFSLSLARATLWESYRALFWADYDLTIFEMEDRRKKFWLDVYRDMYKDYFPFRRERNDYHPCSFTPIFDSAQYMCSYYRKLWGEMLAFDIHETFNNEDDVPTTGERLKTTILLKGSGDLQSELYRRFQGRDPVLHPICDFYDPPRGLLDKLSRNFRNFSCSSIEQFSE